ncbi:hypothetical protein GCM10017044_06010 [Kordiimonas sediminis]|uniref:histidine kinase n=1 Tax=Kordiimonas sediminis TaxID=1735581 RepID=A0A919ANQ4_9PROT|nr:HAMP domain-containing sensor histidine kinase [Kordiimonas sediminis]GHF14710.1 hypothetical protein GCM10017044_06010 [Kordiimonas sediminis]
MAVLDLVTLRWVAFIYYAAFLILLLLIRQKHKDVPGTLSWVLFTALIFGEATIALDNDLRRFSDFVHVGNAVILFGYMFLMVGCVHFTRSRLPKKLLLYISLFIVGTGLLSYFTQVPTLIRVSFAMSVIIGSMLYSIIILWRWNGFRSKTEKNFLMACLAIHLLAFIVRVYVNAASVTFNFNPDVVDSWTSLTLVVTNACILMSIHLMITAFKHQRLEDEIRARYDAEMNALSSLQKVQEANESKSRFMASVSHELRTPLNAIIGFADTIQAGIAGPVNEKQQEYLGYIHSSGEVLLRLINDVLNFTTLKENKVSIRAEAFDLTQLVAETIPMLDSILTKKSCKLVTDFKSKEQFPVCADKIRLQQVILNLVTNAAKYGPRGGVITVTVETRPDVVRLSVQDQGPGISAKHKSEIFEPFLRAGQESLGEEGVGLGLSICKTLMQAMGGDIDFENRAEGGSTFWIDIPREYRSESDLEGYI